MTTTARYTKKDIIQILVKHGVTDSAANIDVQFNNVSTDDSFNWASLIKLTVTFKNEDKSLPLIIKPLLETDERIKQQWRITQMFSNEIYLYEELLPKFAPSGIFPQYICGEVNNPPPMMDFVIMEDLKAQGYEMPKEFISLPDDHVVLSLEKLGQLHGACYAYKESHPGEELEWQKRICETRFFENLSEDDELIWFIRNFCQSSMRGVNLLKDTNKYDAELINGLEDRFLNGGTDFFCRLVQPEEPLAVLCHGDFNRNNLMFKYNEKTGQAKSVIFIDLQTPRYASPAMDLSFFLMMNVSTERRYQDFDRYFHIYHSNVIKRLSADYPSFNADKYSVENFLSDYGRHGLYGYLTISFFIPMCMAIEYEQNHPEVVKDRKAKDFIGLEGSDYLRHFRTLYTKESDEYLFHCLKQLADRFGTNILK